MSQGKFPRDMSHGKFPGTVPGAVRQDSLTAWQGNTGPVIPLISIRNSAFGKEPACPALFCIRRDTAPDAWSCHAGDSNEPDIVFQHPVVNIR